jgi:hypothetical protein
MELSGDGTATAALRLRSISRKAARVSQHSAPSANAAGPHRALLLTGSVPVDRFCSMQLLRVTRSACGGGQIHAARSLNLISGFVLLPNAPMGICGSKPDASAGSTGGISGGSGAASGGAAGGGAAAAVAVSRQQPPVNDATKLTREEKQALMEKTIIADREGETIVRRPGDIAGWDMNLEGCKGCTILVFDRIGALTGDDCEDCTIIIGPCSTSVFVRKFKRCTIVVACQQFRTRQLEDCTILMYTQSRPVVESSRNLRFGCHPLAYAQLPEQMAFAGLSPLCNPWSAIHDFTPSPLSYSLLTEAEEQAAAAKVRALPACAEMGADFARDMIPVTFGARQGRPPATAHGVFVAAPDPAALVAQLSDLSATDGVKVIRTDVQPGSNELLTALKTFAGGSSALPPALAKAAKAPGVALVCVEVAGPSAPALVSTMEGWGGLSVADSSGAAEFLFPNYQVCAQIRMGKCLSARSEKKDVARFTKRISGKPPRKTQYLCCSDRTKVADLTKIHLYSFIRVLSPPGSTGQQPLASSVCFSGLCL